MDPFLMLHTINELILDICGVIVDIGRRKYMMRNFSSATWPKLF
jgi:hypothetical protein